MITEPGGKKQGIFSCIFKKNKKFTYFVEIKIDEYVRTLCEIRY